MKKGSTRVVGMPDKSREELLAEVMAHPTFAVGHQSTQPRFQPTAEELALATATGQPASVIEAIKKKSAPTQTGSPGTTPNVPSSSNQPSTTNSTPKSTTDQPGPKPATETIEVKQ
jgi:hypothetical protein